MGRGVVHHNDHMTCLMVSQKLIEEVNHLRRCNPLLMQDEEQASLRIDGRQRGHATAFPCDVFLGSLPARCPRLGQERRERDVAFVLKIQQRPVFLDRLADLGHLIAEPCFTLFVVLLKVLSLRLRVLSARVENLGEPGRGGKQAGLSGASVAAVSGAKT
jgi:hypothetical protein